MYVCFLLVEVRIVFLDYSSKVCAAISISSTEKICMFYSLGKLESFNAALVEQIRKKQCD